MKKEHETAMEGKAELRVRAARDGILRTHNAGDEILTRGYPAGIGSWGIISLTIAYFWQLYTLWILVKLHEAVLGRRYNRYVELAQQAAFGKACVCKVQSPDGDNFYVN